MTLDLSDVDAGELKSYYFRMTQKKPTDELKLIGAKIKHYRLKTGKTQEEFAKEIGVSRTYYISIENGRDIRTSTWLKILRAFQVSLDHFYPTQQECILLSNKKLSKVLEVYEKKGP